MYCSAFYCIHSQTTSIRLSLSHTFTYLYTSLWYYLSLFSGLLCIWITEALKYNQVKCFAWLNLPSELHNKIISFCTSVQSPFCWIHYLPGSWSPGTKSLSTPFSVITAIRITPPEEPSRDMASARANDRQVNTKWIWLMRWHDRRMIKLTVLDKINTLFPVHVVSVCSVAVTVNVRWTWTANSKWLLMKWSSQWYIVHSSALLLIPASNNDTSWQLVFVLIAHFLEQGGGCIHWRRLILLHTKHDEGEYKFWSGINDRRNTPCHIPVHLQVVLNNISYCLGVGGWSRPTTVDQIMHFCQFVGHSVSDIWARGRTRIGANNDSILECNRHNGGLVSRSC